ncbi:hypothetical protein [Burkholderia sp. TSV86]|uniref:hypothetical protein n=1 Tax=Burkholderia sp. TSV86 TaxID=1385594 RepID=UPI00075591FE|nr:hypothetical protein [Burkholderia sp. TSV86]KVE36626.1 hypothetical protein WS68_04045 [Burkholderia sp. TSV86]
MSDQSAYGVMVMRVVRGGARQTGSGAQAARGGLSVRRAPHALGAFVSALANRADVQEAPTDAG